MVFTTEQRNKQKNYLKKQRCINFTFKFEYFTFTGTHTVKYLFKKMSSGFGICP